MSSQNKIESTDVMILDNAALQVSIAPGAITAKTRALEESEMVSKVENACQQSFAVAAQAGLDSLIRITEKARKQIKQPVIELGRKIDAQAESFVKELTDERNRVTMLVANFQALELARVRAAEAAARMEAERIERERLAELRRIQEAQESAWRIRKEEEIAAMRAAQSAKNEREHIEARRLQAEIDRQREIASAQNLEAIEAAQERFNAQSAALAAQPVVVASKAEGQVVKNDWEVIVNDPYKLAKYHPQCVSITAKIGEIKQLLAQGISVNGVTATQVIKSGTRSTTSQKLIEV